MNPICVIPNKKPAKISETVMFWFYRFDEGTDVDELIRQGNFASLPPFHLVYYGETLLPESFK